jgi:asparaginyl-tRNA synthetase
MGWLKVTEALKAAAGTPLTVKGWVRTRRDSKAEGGLSFLAVHDGTCQDPIQVVARGDLLIEQPEVIAKILTHLGLCRALSGPKGPTRVHSPPIESLAA